MYLTCLVHRRRLHDIAMRWMCDDPQPDDGRAVTEILLFEGLVSIFEARTFMDGLYGEVFGQPLGRTAVGYKHEVREMALEALRDPTPRQHELMQAYHANPEAFFRRMPIAGELIHGPDGALIGSHRIKRPRRVAEKACRRMADFLGGVIRRRATELARDRAESLGVPLEKMVTPSEEQVREFTRAEESLGGLFKASSITVPAAALHIDDVIGYKVIGDSGELLRTEDYIVRHPSATVVDREEHTGEYNAVNILVDLQLPPAQQIISRCSAVDWRFGERRGLTAEQLAADFPDYIRTGAPHIRIELILTTFDEFLESELGRCIHEYRVLEQRFDRDYTGPMAKNAEFIIEYLLAVAFGPSVDFDAIPVKMWGHYLPETLAHAIRKLYQREQTALISPPR